MTYTSSGIYNDIAERTKGSVYIGVVGPVRTGKSTFIKKFMESMVLPAIQNQYDKERARDEMPQSAAGRTVMTTEPKFVPDDPLTVKLSDNAQINIKLVDCVGFIVPDALGHIENGQPRMVRTPWSQEQIPFELAAEIGTKKVITDHATIGIMVTTDGSICDIPRESYTAAEERAINELKALNKPFVIVLNSSKPESEGAVALALELEEKYQVPVALVNCLDLNAEDITHILELILFEFPVTEIGVDIPRWMLALEEEHPICVSVNGDVMKCAQNIRKTGDIAKSFEELSSNEYIKSVNVESIELGCGRARVSVSLNDDLYYKTMGELTGFEITDEEGLIELMRDLSVIKKKYDKIASALYDVSETGYGIVNPDIDDLRLEEPEIVKQSGGYGVRLRASAPSIHMIKADIETEINPIVGTEQQSEDLVRYMLHEFEEDPKRIWESNMFGKTLHELVNEGLHTKLEKMPMDAREKLCETLQRIINEGSSGLICIIL